MWLLVDMVDKTAHPDAPEFTRRISLDDAAAFHGRFEATPEERARLTALFRILDLAAFSGRYRIEPLSQHRYRLSGEFSAELTQACVVTAEPVASRLQEAFSIEFWPEAQLSDFETDDLQPDLENDPPEAIEDGKIDVGAFAAEILASCIDPYPRKTDAEFVWQDPKDGVDKPTGPFAELAKLKRNR